MTLSRLYRSFTFDFILCSIQFKHVMSLQTKISHKRGYNFERKTSFLKHTLIIFIKLLLAH